MINDNIPPVDMTEYISEVKAIIEADTKQENEDEE